MADSHLVLSLTTLPRQIGATRHFDIDWQAPDDLGTPAMAVPEGDELTLGVDLTSVDDGVLVQLYTDVNLSGECVRCLDPVVAHHAISSAEVYFEPGSAPTQLAASDGDEDGDDLFLIGQRDTIDLETQVRDAIITLVDERPLCKPDCRGLCDVCGEKWEELPADHEHFVVDPRLASLAGLLNSDDADADSDEEEQD
ncbi:YceD family protein [Schaalia vaccimaxillae]|uniref:YceD family protein n=1 Tax=Schaalia vaccimaxillae TaxID=183916 RepID=UPI0003B5F2A4|nr:YceD family protein [Schaalia vaccimaxillae]